jgi:hypothetical protein
VVRRNFKRWRVLYAALGLRNFAARVKVTAAGPIRRIRLFAAQDNAPPQSLFARVGNRYGG